MTLEKKNNHVQEALDNLIELFKDKPVFAALIGALVRQIQDLENSNFELLTERWLENAVGVQLDGFGSIVGESREGRDDIAYKVAIKARILLNLGNGTPEDIILLLNVLSDGKTIQLTEYYPAAFTVFVQGALSLTEAFRLNRALQSGKPAGVGAHLIFGEVDPDELLQFDDGPGWDQGRWATILSGDSSLVYLKSRFSDDFFESRASEALILR